MFNQLFLWISFIIQINFHCDKISYCMGARTGLKTLFEHVWAETLCLHAFMVVMGSGRKFLTRVGSGQFFVARVSHLGFRNDFGKFSLKMSNFLIFFPSGQKKSLWVGSKSTWVKGGSVSYLLRVKRKLGSGQGPSLFMGKVNPSWGCDQQWLKVYVFANLKREDLTGWSAVL